MLWNDEKLKSDKRKDEVSGFQLCWKPSSVFELVFISRALLQLEMQTADKLDNPANFGERCAKHCMCEVPGQVPCPSIVLLPKSWRGKYKFQKSDELWRAPEPTLPPPVLLQCSQYMFVHFWSWRSPPPLFQRLISSSQVLQVVLSSIISSNNFFLNSSYSFIVEFARVTGCNDYN